MSARKRAVSDESRMKKRKRQREWKQKRREEGIKMLGGHCVDCEETDGLEFDHVDPRTKLFEMTDIWSRSYAIRVAEILKCVLRCSSCHLTKTLKDRSTTEEEFAKRFGCTKEQARELRTPPNYNRIF